jgi:Flp pilus assembly protein TadG
MRVAHQPCDRRGAAAAELALWLPFLALMFAVAVDFCRVYYATQVVQNSALAGAMYLSGIATANPAASSAADPVVQAAVAEAASLNPPLTAANVSSTTSAGTAQVTVSYDFPLILPWSGLGSKITITRTVAMTQVPRAGT